MAHARILLIGGSGFIGSQVAARLAASGRRVTVPTRRYERARHLLPLPTVEVRVADVHDDAQLGRLVAQADAVVNLVGILHDRRGTPWGAGFEQAHVRLPARIAAACAASGVRRLLHMSALGVREDGEQSLPSMYLRSKAAGERVVRAAPALDWTIFRPSVVYGPGDRFLNLFARLQAWLPVMPLGRADARFQPVFVGDVAQAFVNALDGPVTHGRCYELAGPEVFTLRQLVALAGVHGGHRRPIVALPDALGRLQAALLEFAPGPTLMSRDNFDSMSIDNVASGPIAAELDLTPTPLGAIAPAYLRRGPAPFGIERMRARR
ncbi:MAG: complex I NDUFA9 subunit family protein [Burkholderiaceae bacterium]|nr:complex I NDUFA9 subunit family protein [Burkholderiaceae bacterium]MEB2352121.1 complex I NDUFA9 subunit family protein [Burkholderiaceae bacterium]